MKRLIFKLERVFVLVLFFSIPFQTRIILKSWRIGFNEWNSSFFYWTDLLVLLIITFWFLRILLKIEKPIFDFSNYDWFLVGFLVVLAISIKNSSNQILSLYKLIKIIDFSLLYFYIKSNIDILKNSLTVFLFSGVFQSIISILQYIKQTDLGLKFLGETFLNPNLFNVAIFLVKGERVMRSYGTTPHPNVLAVILFSSLFVLYFYYFKKSKITNLILFFIYPLLIFGFFFTFSRIIIFIWLIGFVAINLIYKKFSFDIKNYKIKKLISITLIISAIFSILFFDKILARISISFNEEAVQLRGYYNRVSFLKKPLFGVGYGNFVNWMMDLNPNMPSYFYQPVHNIYLLIFSETGIFGLSLFLLFLIFLIKEHFKIKSSDKFSRYYFAINFLLILFSGFFDHLLLTLQQGQFIFWIFLGLIGGFSKIKSL